MPRKKNVHPHIFHFALLLASLLVFMAAVLIFSQNRQLQQYLIYGMGLAYVLWGAFHHYSEGDLHPRVLLEYIVMALLASSILLSIIMRA